MSLPDTIRPKGRFTEGYLNWVCIECERPLKLREHKAGNTCSWCDAWRRLNSRICTFCHDGYSHTHELWIAECQYWACHGCYEPNEWGDKPLVCPEPRMDINWFRVARTYKNGSPYLEGTTLDTLPCGCVRVVFKDGTEEHAQCRACDDTHTHASVERPSDA